MMNMRELNATFFPLKIFLTTRPDPTWYPNFFASTRPVQSKSKKKRYTSGPIWYWFLPWKYFFDIQIRFHDGYDNWGEKVFNVTVHLQRLKPYIDCRIQCQQLSINCEYRTREMIQVKSCVCVFEMFLFTEPANHFHDRTWHSGITAVFLDCRRTDNSPGLGLGNKEIWQQSHSKECHKSIIWLNKSMVDKIIQICHMIQNFMTKLYDL